MKKALVFLGASLGGTVGWWAGEGGGIMTAFIVSMIGTGLGMYAGVKLAQKYEV